jgi:hypothetical protein
MKATCVLLALLGLAPLSGAQRIDGLAVYRETREITAAFVGSLDVDASPVGAIAVHGWDGADVLIRAQVTANEPSEWQAMALAAQVVVTEAAGVVRSSGPVEDNTRQWSVAYEIYLPHAADLVLKAKVGAISIENVTGTIRCATSVGSLQLVSLGGAVQCATSVGSVSIALAGDHWDGSKLDVRTNVGSVELNVPANYSAHLELSTGLGSIVSDLPLPVVKNGMGRTVSTDIGAGGATIHAATNVGSVTVGSSVEPTH